MFCKNQFLVSLRLVVITTVHAGASYPLMINPPVILDRAYSKNKWIACKKRDSPTLLCPHGDHPDDPSKLLVILRKFILPPSPKSPPCSRFTFHTVHWAEWMCRETSDIKRKGEEGKMLIRPLVFDATFAHGIIHSPAGRMYDRWSGVTIQTVCNWITNRRRDNFLQLEFHSRPPPTGNSCGGTSRVRELCNGCVQRNAVVVNGMDLQEQTNNLSMAPFPPSRIQCFPPPFHPHLPRSIASQKSSEQFLLARDLCCCFFRWELIHHKTTRGGSSSNLCPLRVHPKIEDDFTIRNPWDTRGIYVHHLLQCSVDMVNISVGSEFQ